MIRMMMRKVMVVLLVMATHELHRIDEMVLKTHWLYHHLPRSSDDPIRLIYTPLLWLLSRVTGMPHP